MRTFATVLLFPVLDTVSTPQNRFNMREGYPHSLGILHAFVKDKHNLTRDEK